MTKIFKIDFGLYLLGIFTILTGFGLHIAGHGYSHQVWEVWCIIHSVVSVLFTVLVINHVRSHWAWFKKIRLSTIFGKRFVTTVLAMVSCLTIFSGIALLAIFGDNTHIGLLHFKIGVGFAILLSIHGVKRVGLLRRAISSNNKIDK